MIIRLLTDDDRPRAKALWRDVFDDPPAFVDWFFEKRYLPRWSVGAFDGQKLISVIHGTPMELSLDGSSFPALMTSGVATVPEERGRGYMHAAMRFLQAQADGRGIRVLFNHPQRAGAYARLGFRPGTFTRYWEGQETDGSGTIAPFSEEEAFRVYSALADRYDGFVRRTRDAFHLKMEDYLSDGARSFLLQEGGETVGYCVFFEKEGVYGEEVLSLRGYGAMLSELNRIADGRSVTAKLPPDADAAGRLLCQNVMLAPEDIWRRWADSRRIRFCVDEY